MNGHKNIDQVIRSLHLIGDTSSDIMTKQACRDAWILIEAMKEDMYQSNLDAIHIRSIADSARGIPGTTPGMNRNFDEINTKAISISERLRKYNLQ